MIERPSFRKVWIPNPHLDSDVQEMLTQKLPHKDMSFGQVLASVGTAKQGLHGKPQVLLSLPT